MKSHLKAQFVREFVTVATKKGNSKNFCWPVYKGTLCTSHNLNVHPVYKFTICVKVCVKSAAILCAILKAQKRMHSEWLEHFMGRFRHVLYTQNGQFSQVQSKMGNWRSLSFHFIKKLSLLSGWLSSKNHHYFQASASSSQCSPLPTDSETTATVVFRYFDEYHFFNSISLVIHSFPPFTLFALAVFEWYDHLS